VNDGLHAPVLYRERPERREREQEEVQGERERKRKVREDGESGVCNGEKQEQESGKS